MSVKTDAIGKEWPATQYEVGKEKIGEYARVLGIENPVHFDREAAKAAGFRDVVAPPMFAVVYSSPAVGPAMFDHEREEVRREHARLDDLPFRVAGARRPGVRVGRARLLG